MKKINFKEFTIKLDIAGTKKQTVDVREAFANILYSRVNGIRAHSLSITIYRSDGILEITGEDAELIGAVAAQFCTPAFIDAINEQLNNQEQ
ncbi:hypothetical protein FACS189451_07890 [Bacteroidia bacterium]|nr:hypothetical protein FACS189451_07890 [Bacteroidia bacterium]